MKLIQMENLLMQEMEEVRGGNGVCTCPSGAGQSTGTGECKCDKGAAQLVVLDPGTQCFCNQNGALQKI